MIQINQPVQEGKKSGSRLGGILGLLGAAGAAVATGGMSIPATVGLLAGGASLGQSVGGLAKPGSASSQSSGIQTDDGAMTRRLKSGEHQQKMEQLKQSAVATAQLPEAERAKYLEPIMSAADILKRQTGGEY
jgi:hypothetical protein